MALFEIEMGGSSCIIIEIVPGVTIKLNLKIGLAGFIKEFEVRSHMNYRSM